MIGKHGETAPREALADLIHQARTLSRRAHLAAVKAPSGVPLSNNEGLVLQYVCANPGVRTSEISQHLGLQLANASTAVSVLLDKGLVRREPDPADRRATTVWPTAESARVLKAVHTHWQRLVGEVDTHELAAAARLLARVAHALEGDPDR